MKINSINSLRFNSNGIKLNKKTNNFKTDSYISRDTVSFGGRTYENIDSDIQLYRGVGKSEVKALLEGKTIEGASCATSNPQGYHRHNWRLGGGYDDYFITFNKFRIEFSEHSEDNSDTRYIVEPYNLADIESIRKGTNSHGELIYSMDFQNGKKNDILAKQQDIENILMRIKNKNLSKKAKENCIDILKSYTKEFPDLAKAVKIVRSPLMRRLFKIKEEYLIPIKTDKNEDKEIMALLKSVTPKKVEEFDAIRIIKEKTRKINTAIDIINDYSFSKQYKEETLKKLKIKIKVVKERLGVLNSIINKSNPEKFEIECLNKVLENFKALKI